MEIVGVIQSLQYHKLNREHFKYHKLEVVLLTADIFRKTVVVNLWGRNIKKFTLEKGQKIAAHVSASSKRYGQKWYTSLDIYDLEQL